MLSPEEQMSQAMASLVLDGMEEEERRLFTVVLRCCAEIESCYSDPDKRREAQLRHKRSVEDFDLYMKTRQDEKAKVSTRRFAERKAGGKR